MNLRQTAYRLQTALCQRGRYIKINQQQIYSDNLERMVTKYVLRESENINGKKKDVTLLETFQMVDVVKKLVKELGEADGPDS